MTAGPELDCLIAEKVMSLTSMKGKGMVGGYWDTSKKRTQMVKNSPLHEARKKLGITDDESGDGFTLSYSSDIAASWTVVEKLGGSFKLSRYKDGTSYAEFILPYAGPIITGHEGFGTALSESVPEAICLAALKAVGVLSHSGELK